MKLIVIISLFVQFGAFGSDLSTKDIELFKKAKKYEKDKDSANACLIYKDLAGKTEFVLKGLADLYRIKNCSIKLNEALDFLLREKHNDYPKWLKEVYTRTAYKKSSELKLDHKKSFFSYKLSFYEGHAPSKIDYVKKAIAYAKSKNIRFDRELYEERLYKIAPRLNPKVTNKNRYSVARDWEKKRKFKKARELYNQIIKSPTHSFNEKRKAYNRVRLSYKNERKKGIYTEKTLEMLNWLKKKKKTKEVLLAIEGTTITYAQILWTRNETTRARKVLEKLVKKDISSENKVLALWTMGKIQIEQKNSYLAMKSFKDAIELDSKDITTKEKVTWSLAWNYYLMNQFTNAIEVFKKLENMTKSTSTKAKALFWQGRSLKKSGKRKESISAYQKAVATSPFNYYAIVAQIELAQPFSPLNNQLPKITNPLPKYDALLAVDELLLAHKYISEQKIPSEEKAVLFFKAKQYNKGMGAFFRLSQEKKDKLRKDYLPIIYPMAFSEQISSVAGKYNLPSALFFSLIRQESAFNHKARSHADAFGLMQLIPAKGKEISTKMKISYSGFSDLYNPEKNILMGGYLLKQLLDKFNNNFVKLTISYNAGQSVIPHWFKTRFKGDYIDFIERVPYRETRLYIKLLMRNYIIYQRLLSKKAFTVTSKVFEETNF